MFSGTWAGPPQLETLPDATTVFGSGIVARGDDLHVVTPGHVMESVWFAEQDGALIFSNSMVGLLEAARLELDPGQPYPRLMLPMAELRWMLEDPGTGLLRNYSISFPTLTVPITQLNFENLRVELNGRWSVAAKPREGVFASFADFRERLLAATASLIANAPSYEPVVTLSGGYDSTAVAAVVAQLGGRRGVSLGTGRLFPGGRELADDGRDAAGALDLQLEVFDREAYRARADHPEAEFLAGGMTGEDVPVSTFEHSIGKSLFFTGFWTGRLWAGSREYPPAHLPPGDFSGSGITEFALRADFIHVPLPTFGAAQGHGTGSFVHDEDMAPFTLHSHYDRPVPRRLAEEAGIPRGAFATRKRAASVMVQRDPGRWFAPATQAAIADFARREGRRVRFRRRGPTPRWHRALIRLGLSVGAGWLVRHFEARRLSLVHFDNQLGNVALRWAVERIRPRYESARLDRARAGDLDSRDKSNTGVDRE